MVLWIARLHAREIARARYVNLDLRETQQLNSNKGFTVLAVYISSFLIIWIPLATILLVQTFCEQCLRDSLALVLLGVARHWVGTTRNGQGSVLVRISGQIERAVELVALNSHEGEQGLAIAPTAMEQLQVLEIGSDVLVDRVNFDRAASQFDRGHALHVRQRRVGHVPTLVAVEIAIDPILARLDQHHAQLGCTHANPPHSLARVEDNIPPRNPTSGANRKSAWSGVFWER